MKKHFIAAALACLGFGLFVTVPQAGAATDLFNRCTSVDATQCKIVKENNLDYKGTNSIWKLVQFALGILGGISVIMIVIGGIKFATSAGDASGVSSAKNTILYAVIGLVVALMASGIVLLVTQYFT
jgi:hypothetical protein